MTRYVAFLRGINLNGRTVPMAELRKAFEALDFANVRTLLASGNVLFEVDADASEELVDRIEAQLKQTFGMSIGVVLRSIDELRGLADKKPFKGIEVTPDTRLYVTFLPDKAKAGADLSAPGENVEIVRESRREVCSVITLSPSKGTTDLMSFLDKRLGKGVTTRNWNTVERVLKA